MPTQTYVITTTPSNPARGQYERIKAINTLHALDQFAIKRGFVAYGELENWPEFMGIDQHGLWGVFGNETIWAIPINPCPAVSSLEYEGLSVLATRNSNTGQLIVLINTEAVSGYDKDDEGYAFIEITLDDCPVHEYGEKERDE